MTNEVFRNDPNSSELTQKVNSGKLVVFIGSGLSSGEGGFPTWWELVKKLCDQCKIKYNGDINKSTPPEQLQLLAGWARERDETKFIHVLESEFAKTVVTTKRAYDLLMRAQFLSYVTTNFDPLLAMELDHHQRNDLVLHVFPELNHFKLGSGGVFYLHGYVPQGGPVDIKRLVLTKTDFEIAYSQETNDLCLFWELLLLKCDVLFVGCRLGEPELKFIFSKCNTIRNERSRRYELIPRPRYILLPKQQVKLSGNLDEKKIQELQQLEIEEGKRFNEFDIKVVRYDEKDPSHSGLIEILEEWIPRPRVTLFKENPLEDY